MEINWYVKLRKAVGADDLVSGAVNDRIRGCCRSGGSGTV